ncbi:MAG: class I SAM-dependent methyltransferase [bacterium]|nr:class I SAM-dependent methyltransferase [bacterium]
MSRLALLVPVVLGLAWAQDPPATQDAAPAMAEEPRTHYRGRRIARTMHWRGAEWLLRETREDEESSERMLAALDVREGATVCDLGCGNGFHALPLARAVGESGKVLGVDIQPEMLRMLAERAREIGVENVRPVLGTPADPRLPESSCDLVFLADVYHEIDHPVSVLEHVRAALKKDGRLALLEFRLEDPDSPIEKLHRMSKAQILNELAPNGLRVVREVDTLPMQHLMFFGRRDRAPDETPDAARRAHGEEVGRGFWRAVAAGDAGVLGAFAADEVHLYAGSELTRERWGGSGTEEVAVAVKYRRRYAALVESIGVARWQSALKDLGELRFRTAAEAGLGEADDLVLEVSAGENEEPFLYVLRYDNAGRWLVVGERADY